MDETSWRAANNAVIPTGNLHSHHTATFLTPTYFQQDSKKPDGYITRLSEPWQRHTKDSMLETTQSWEHNKLTRCCYVSSCGLCGEWDWCHISGTGESAAAFIMTGLMCSIKTRHVKRGHKTGSKSGTTTVISKPDDGELSSCACWMWSERADGLTTGEVPGTRGASVRCNTGYQINIDLQRGTFHTVLIKPHMYLSVFTVYWSFYDFVLTFPIVSLPAKTG